MKRSWLKYSLLGLAVYLLTVIATIPAQLGYNLAKRKLPTLAVYNLYDLGGSIWSGHAATVTYRQNSLGKLQWQLAPAYLVLGKLAAHWRLQPETGVIEGKVVASMDSASLHAISGRLPASSLNMFNLGLPIAADGVLSFELEQVTLPRHGSPAIQGIVSWSQASVTVGQVLQLGELKLTLQTADKGGTNGVIADAGGPLEITGNLAIDANGVFRIDAKLRSRPSADDSLRSGLELLGKADPRGYYTLRYSGRM